MENNQNLIKLLEALNTYYPERISNLTSSIYQILKNQNLDNLDRNIIYNYLHTLNDLISNIAISSRRELRYLLRDTSNKNNTQNKEPEIEPER